MNRVDFLLDANELAPKRPDWVARELIRSPSLSINLYSIVA